MAYDLLLQDTYPSWGYMIANGATTWWERWNGDSGDPAMNSHNHYSFGSVVAWIYSDAVGIDADEHAPGFQHVVIEPHYTAKLAYARGEYNSMYGMIKSGWVRLPQGSYKLTVTVPPNVSATFYLNGTPGERPLEVGAGIHEFTTSSVSAIAVRKQN